MLCFPQRRWYLYAYRWTGQRLQRELRFHSKLGFKVRWKRTHMCTPCHDFGMPSMGGLPLRHQYNILIPVETRGTGKRRGGWEWKRVKRAQRREEARIVKRQTCFCVLFFVCLYVVFFSCFFFVVHVSLYVYSLLFFVHNVCLLFFIIIFYIVFICFICFVMLLVFFVMY